MPDRAPTLSQLLALTAAGDYRAFAQVYERTHTHLFGVALRLLGRQHTAEDVLQEAFVSIWHNAGQYQPGVAAGSEDAQPMGWLVAIVRNKSLDALRAHGRRRESELADDEDGDGGAHGTTPSALELLSQAARAMQVERCLESLDGTHRQSLALAYYQGLSHSEVAAQMDAPLGSVKAWIRRGLDKLKSCLEAKG